MRFFKYLFLLFFLFPSFTFAQALLSDLWTYQTYQASTPEDLCHQLVPKTTFYPTRPFSRINIVNRLETSATCQHIDSANIVMNVYTLNLKPPLCPQKDYPQQTWINYGDSVPTRTCTKLSNNKYCIFENPNPRVTNYPNYQHVVLFSLGTDSYDSCTPTYKGQCDKTDPYGGCYTPPNDGCTRQYDGSIVCPSDTPPPEPEPTCGGATYCVRPPEGCGTGYVSGSFNGQQLCVKSDPSTPPNPTEPTEPPPKPNSCTAQYCPKPEPDKECPMGYYTSYYNGSAICVANNPNPNQPNQNDPNNNENASSEPVGGDDPNTNFDVKGIIDAIKALRDSLLGSIENVSKKLTTLIDGQKTTNDHLTKLNEKSQKANEHLQNIEDSSLATSEAVGETNKKLDQIFSDQGKDQIDQLGQQSTDSRLTNAESETNSKIQQLANTLSYSSSHACISDFTVTGIPHFGSMTVPFSKYCDLLALLKLLLKLATLMLALRMIDATVRVF